MDFFTEDYLEHHGVRGQKWGVRRYQNADGSLTPRGKKRVAKLNAKVDKIYAKKTKNTQKKIDAWDEANKRTVLSDYKVHGKRVRKYASAKDKKIAAKGQKAQLKQTYQSKLRDIRKVEIRKGFNYYERENARNWRVGYLIGGIPGGVVGESLAARKYKEGINARRELKKDAKENWGWYSTPNDRSASYNKYINRK